jgi:hypothetical protein
VQGIAGYVRLGITPNLSDGAWYVAVICRRKKPLVSITDYKSPIPGDTLHLSRPLYEATHNVRDPLKAFQIHVKERGSVHNDASSVFRCDPGQGSADLAMDLDFHTDGTPYQYRIATRYKIPCRVSGTVWVDGESYIIISQFGQRDHSWGVRNWWNMDWCWSSLHLDDGTQSYGW